LAHRLVIKRSVDVLSHALPVSDWLVGSLPPALAQRRRYHCIGIRRSGAGPKLSTLCYGLARPAARIVAPCDNNSRAIRGQKRHSGRRGGVKLHASVYRRPQCQPYLPAAEPPAGACASRLRYRGRGVRISVDRRPVRLRQDHFPKRAAGPRKTGSGQTTHPRQADLRTGPRPGESSTPASFWASWIMMASRLLRWMRRHPPRRFVHDLIALERDDP